MTDLTDALVMLAVIVFALAVWVGMVAVGAWALVAFTSLSAPVAVLISYAFFALLSAVGN